MSVRRLCMEPAHILRQPAQPIERFADELRRLTRDMIDTMYAHEGIGLAAPQIGQPLQVFVANASHQPGCEVVVANPVIEATSGHASVVEGCLSVPDVWERVRRAARVRVRGYDVHGRPLTLEAEGLLAIIVQHEVDHLYGRLFIDRLSWCRRWRVARRRRLAPAAE